MSDITITVTEIVDALSVESTPTSITVFDGVFVDSGGGGGGAVDSVNGETGVVVLTATDVGADVTGAAAAAQAASQPLDSDLTAIAALSTSSFGRALLALADAAAARTAIGAGTSSFDGAYSSLTGTPTLGTAAAAATGDFDAAGAAAAAQAASQPLDSDLTAIAALSTSPFGRSLLTAADAAAARALTGAGTSSLAIGTTSSTAKAGDYQPTAANISDSTTIGRTVLTAADAAAVRTAIGAGTSSLAIGTTGSTAKAGDYQPASTNISDATAVGKAVLTGTDAAAVRTTLGLGTAATISATAGGDLSGTLPSPTVTKLNGTSLAGLATGLLKNTTATGVPSIAVAADIPNIAESQVTNLVSDLALKAPLASPTFTGTVTIPTATAADSTTKAASTAFVQGELAAKAPLASPALTGNPTAPTQTAGNNSTRLATTAYVDTSFAPLASPALTGNPTAPTASVGDNDTSIATTAFVAAAIAAGPIDATKVTHTVNAQTGTTYTLVLGDAGKFVTMTNASASTLTVPPNSSVAFPVGTMLDGAQLGAGQVTLTAGAGVTINATPGLKIAAQYGTFGLLKTATDVWLAFGRLSA